MAWLHGKKVEALWSNHEESNVWSWIDGAWRKLDDDEFDATTNFTILAAHAKQTNSNVDVNIDGDRVKEMYVW